MVGRLRRSGPPSVATVADGLAGAGVDYRLSAGWAELLAVTVELTTAAGGGARFARVTCTDTNGLTVWQAVAAFSRSGGGVQLVSFVAGAAAGGANDAAGVTVPLGRIPSGPRWTVHVDAVGAAGADALAGVTLLLQPLELELEHS